jgi:hypothetical protein
VTPFHDEHASCIVMLTAVKRNTMAQELTIPKRARRPRRGGVKDTAAWLINGCDQS